MSTTWTISKSLDGHGMPDTQANEDNQSLANRQATETPRSKMQEGPSNAQSI
jgi:hypothetical protein